MNDEAEAQKQAILGALALVDHNLIEKVLLRSKELVDRTVADIESAKTEEEKTIECVALSLAVIDLGTTLEEIM